MEHAGKSAAMTFADFLYEVNHQLMGDFVSMRNDEISCFQKMEKLLESKLSHRFKIRRLEKQKLTEGKALIKYFCVPCAPTKVNGGRTRNLPEHDMEK